LEKKIGDVPLVFRRFLNYKVQESPTDSIELDLVFGEAVTYVVRNKFPISQEVPIDHLLSL
jgi:hypothetical protein